MLSSNNRGQSSPIVRHRSLGRLQDLGSIRTGAATENGPSSSEQRATAQAAQLANQFQQLQVNRDVNIASAHAITTGGGSTQLPCQENESLAEEELIERLKEIINEFMTRPGRRYAYNTTMRWTIDHGNELDYSVVILISQPSDLI